METSASQADNTALPVIDREDAIERLGGAEDLLDEFLELLLKQATTDLPQIVQAVEQGNADRLEYLAHRLKGAAASLSAERVRQAAFDLETIGRDGDMSKAQPALALLEQEVTLLRQTVGR
jgi:HPt (histidine-containing phosphotransfer) domain-containing protein